MRRERLWAILGARAARQTPRLSNQSGWTPTKRKGELVNKNQILGLAGASILLVGVFLPTLEWPPNTYTFFGRSGRLTGVLVLLMAIAAFPLALRQKFQALLGLTTIVAAIVLYRFYGVWDTVVLMNDSVTLLRRLGPGEGHTRPSLQYGWGVLFAGIALLFTASSGEAQRVWKRLFSAPEAANESKWRIHFVVASSAAESAKGPHGARHWSSSRS
jgi:hypothetical protein